MKYVQKRIHLLTCQRNKKSTCNFIRRTKVQDHISVMISSENRCLQGPLYRVPKYCKCKKNSSFLKVSVSLTQDHDRKFEEHRTSHHHIYDRMIMQITQTQGEMVNTPVPSTPQLSRPTFGQSTTTTQKTPLSRTYSQCEKMQMISKDFKFRLTISTKIRKIKGR